MFFPEAQVRVWLYTQPTDMRKSYDGLSALVMNVLHEDPTSGHLFVSPVGIRAVSKRNFIKVSAQNSNIELLSHFLDISSIRSQTQEFYR